MKLERNATVEFLQIQYRANGKHFWTTPNLAYFVPKEEMEQARWYAYLCHDIYMQWGSIGVRDNQKNQKKLRKLLTKLREWNPEHKFRLVRIYANVQVTEI